MFCVSVLGCLNHLFVLHTYRKVLVCFALRFLANICNDSSYVLRRKFPVCYALCFLANLSNNLSYILHWKFPICFASVF